MEKRWWLVLGAVFIATVTTSTVLAVSKQTPYYFPSHLQPEGGSGITIIADAFNEVDEDWLLFGLGRDLMSFGPGEAWLGFRQSVLDIDTEVIHFQEWDTADNTDDTLSISADTLFLSSNGSGDVVITLGN